MGEMEIYISIGEILKAIGIDEKQAEGKYARIKVGITMDDPYTYMESCGACFKSVCDEKDAHDIVLKKIGEGVAGDGCDIDDVSMLF